MSSKGIHNGARRVTIAAEVFDKLRNDIVSLKLTPGTKLSETEVAKQYDVSRQPVREAFMALGELSLLLIRPQRATLVKKISLKELQDTRFIRAALEIEVIRHACLVAEDKDINLIDKNMDEQRAAVAAGDALMLRDLDYEFHRLISQAAQQESAFRVISANKAHTDRVCTLELAEVEGMQETLQGHERMLSALKARDMDEAMSATRHHLAHLDATIDSAQKNFSDYFEA